MTRDQILAAAAQIFSQKGFHATSMQEIAEAVNLQKASLYHHISSKQDILLTVLDHALDLLIENMEEVMKKPLKPAELLRVATRVYITTILQHRDLSAVLLLEHRSLEPELRVKHIQRRDRFEALWRDLINAGTQAGEFTCGDPEMTVRALLGAMNWTSTWYRPEGGKKPDEIADHFSELFLEGLQKR